MVESSRGRDERRLGLVVIGSSVSALRGQGRWLIMVEVGDGEQEVWGQIDDADWVVAGLLHGGDDSRWDDSGLVWDGLITGFDGGSWIEAGQRGCGGGGDGELLMVIAVNCGGGAYCRRW
ncbi:hypothetical protein M0R45_020391 [Rubus argutus]|uniref:Uncharacterized protein n=1 Tax=Rubus argutus TaxID=59490 RepID=A0AAW1X915_RUBAR